MDLASLMSDSHVHQVWYIARVISSLCSISMCKKQVKRSENWFIICHVTSESGNKTVVHTCRSHDNYLILCNHILREPSTCSKEARPSFGGCTCACESGHETRTLHAQ